MGGMVGLVLGCAALFVGWSIQGSRGSRELGCWNAWSPSWSQTTGSLKVLESGTLFYSQSTSSAVICLQYKKNVHGSGLCVIIQFTSLCR